jgi:hypothetical protein
LIAAENPRPCQVNFGNSKARHAFPVTLRSKENAVDHKDTLTTPVDYRLNTKPYATDPRESQHRAQDQHAEDSIFVFDIEDMALLGHPDDGGKRPHQ